MGLLVSMSMIVQHLIVDEPGSNTNACEIRFMESDSGSCEDIKECLFDVCGKNATFKNTSGSYECSCYSGYSGDGVECAGAPISTTRFHVAVI